MEPNEQAKHSPYLALPIGRTRKFGKQIKVVSGFLVENFCLRVGTKKPHLGDPLVFSENFMFAFFQIFYYIGI